jgi:hypothetical protein
LSAQESNFTSGLSSFLFRSYRHFLNSSPQLPARAVAQGAQLGPGDFAYGHGCPGRSGAGDNVFSADEFSERDDAIGHQF